MLLLLALLMQLVPVQAGQPGQAAGRREVPAPAPPDPSTWPLEIGFEAQSGGLGDARPEPGITVELGVVSVKDFGHGHWNSPVLARVTSDEQGAIRTTLRIPERWRDDPLARIWARVETPGRMRTLGLARADESGGQRGVRLPVRVGGTLLGAVVDASGAAVAGARVQLYAQQAGALVPHTKSRSGPDGAFVIHYPSAGTYTLQARAAKTGSGGLRSLALSLDDLPVPVRVTLLAGVRLHGRVFDSARDPVPGLTLTAVTLEGFPSPARRLELELSGGLVLDRTRTDRGGRFEFPNLVPGVYAIHGEYPALPGSDNIYPDSLGPVLGTAWAPTGEHYELLHHGHRIEVLVVDETGAAVDPSDALSGSTADGNPRLSIKPVEPAAEAWPRPIQVGDLIVYSVQPDCDYGLSWLDPTRPFFETRVQVPWSRPRTEYRIQLEPPAEPARLTVELRDPDGSKRRTSTHLWILGQRSGQVVATTLDHEWCGTQTNSLHGPIWSEPLPPGDYRIIVRSPLAPGTLNCDSSLQRPALTASANVTLHAGEQRTLELHLSDGGAGLTPKTSNR